MSDEELLKEELEDASAVEDESEKDHSIPPIVYNIASYGADPDVLGLVERMRKDDIKIPTFQRAFVWKVEDASSFIESLILGLPVPGIFLATEPDTNKQLVIDGQQRLKSLLFFYDGFFDPKPEAKRKRVFGLIDVQKALEGKTYQTLDQKDKRRLDNSIIHATIVKQESPKDDDTGIYHIFHRLNAGGVILRPQEIRRAAFHSTFLESISQWNDFEAWRQIFGKKNRRLKDEELILRFLALFYESHSYEKPMSEFLNVFASRKKKSDQQFLNACAELFKDTIQVIAGAIGKKAFRPVKVINAAVFDSVMVGVARRLRKDGGQPIRDFEGVRRAYLDLLADTDYMKSVTDGTSDEATVEYRLTRSVRAFDPLR